MGDVMTSKTEIANAVNAIRSLFLKLPPEKKVELIAELTGDGSASSISISDFARLVQKMYRKNITFKISTAFENNLLMITAVCLTPLGEFSAIGKNQGVAKERAVQKAFITFTDIKNKG